MSKYAPLGPYLQGCPGTEIPMRFGEIETVIGASLPPAAERHAAWWSNNPSNNVMTKIWLDAGFKTEKVDLGSRRVVFRRARPTTPGVHPPRATKPASTTLKGESGILERLRATLGGTVRVAEGVDLTAPSGEPWKACDR